MTHYRVIIMLTVSRSKRYYVVITSINPALTIITTITGSFLHDRSQQLRSIDHLIT